MYDAGKIVTGLALFVLAATFPFWSNVGRTAAPPAPDLNTPGIQAQKATECVESTAYMRASHMELLNLWRDQAVRVGNPTYVATSGKQYQISLQNTCLQCHTAAKETGPDPQFCATCHTNAAVKIDCFSCHVAGKEASR